MIELGIILLVLIFLPGIVIGAVIARYVRRRLK